MGQNEEAATAPVPKAGPDVREKYVAAREAAEQWGRTCMGHIKGGDLRGMGQYAGVAGGPNGCASVANELAKALTEFFDAADKDALPVVPAGLPAVDGHDVYWWAERTGLLEKEVRKEKFRADEAESHSRAFQKDAMDSKSRADAAEKDAKSWKLEWEMWRKAWRREIGEQYMPPKTHEIDALVLATRRVMDEKRKAEADLKDAEAKALTPLVKAAERLFGITASQDNMLGVLMEIDSRLSRLSRAKCDLEHMLANAAERVEAEFSADEAKATTLVYTNYKGETRPRKICPMQLRFGTSPQHQEKGEPDQWFIVAWDVEKKAMRNFALKDFKGAPDVWEKIAATPLPGGEIDELRRKLAEAEGLAKKFQEEKWAETSRVDRIDAEAGLKIGALEKDLAEARQNLAEAEKVVALKRRWPDREPEMGEPGGPSTAPGELA